MDTIRTYLDNMFLQLPRTPETEKAKKELLAMMEDKYEELKAEGKAENEAVGTVIAEFGNLDEILGELGVDIKREQARESYREETFQPGDEGERRLSFDEARDYLGFRNHFAVMIGLGVALCILSPVFPILGGDSGIRAMLGVVMLFVFVAAAVGLFIFYGMKSEKYRYLEKEVFFLDEGSKQYFYEQYEEKKTITTVEIILGVVLCILSVIPAIVIETLSPRFGRDVGGLCLLIFVAVAVFLFIHAGVTRDAYEVLLQTKEHSVKKKRKRDDRFLGAISSVYWSLVTLIYLGWSFLSHSWGISWIIWPMAGILWGAIASIWNGLKRG